MSIDPWAKKKSIFSAVSSVPVAPKKTSLFWRIIKYLWRKIISLCTFLGASLLVLLVLSIFSLSAIVQETELPLPKKMVLYLRFDGALSETAQAPDFLDPFAPQPMTLKTFIDTMDRAAKDKRVQGIYAKLEAGGYQIAQLQEMRAAIKRFRESKKFAYIYADSLAETGGLGSYYLASAFEEIWMQPMGVISIAGINAEMPFFRGFLNMVGIEPQFFQRKEYKSAYESATNSSISPANREMMEAVIGDIANTVESDIARERKLTPTQFRSLMDRGLFTATAALKEKLIHQASYADMLEEKISQKVTGDPHTYDPIYVNFSDYAQPETQSGNFFDADFMTSSEKENTGDKPRIALIYTVGAIMDSRENTSDGIAAADEIAPAILDAAEDETIDVIVLRVDSPGGSPVASETILRAVEKAQKKGKKVIVSMGALAASGGYWVSAYADRIFVMPSTLTGSVGVLGGKISLQELWGKLGVRWDTIKRGQNAGLWSMNTPFSETESQQMNMMLDNVYDNFIARVAKGRKMKPEDVEKIARGRVWTGNQAIKIKLADELGGLDKALDYAAKQAGGKDRADAQIVIMPPPLSQWEQFADMLEGQSAGGEVLARLGRYVNALSPNLNALSVFEKSPVGVYEPMRVE